MVQESGIGIKSDYLFSTSLTYSGVTVTSVLYVISTISESSAMVVIQVLEGTFYDSYRVTFLEENGHIFQTNSFSFLYKVVVIGLFLVIIV